MNFNQKSGNKVKKVRIKKRFNLNTRNTKQDKRLHYYDETITKDGILKRLKINKMDDCMIHKG